MNVGDILALTLAGGASVWIVHIVRGEDLEELGLRERIRVHAWPVLLVVGALWLLPRVSAPIKGVLAGLLACAYYLAILFVATGVAGRNERKYDDVVGVALAGAVLGFALGKLL